MACVIFDNFEKKGFFFSDGVLKEINTQYFLTCHLLTVGNIIYAIFNKIVMW